MSRYPVWWDTTITIYNKHTDTVTQQITWYRTVVLNCFWKDTGNKVKLDDVVLDTNGIICRIPENPNFKEKFEWEEIPSAEKSGFFTLAVGDILIKGEVEDEVDEYLKGHRSSDLLKKYKDIRGCMQIDNTSINVGPGRVDPHYWARGV